MNDAETRHSVLQSIIKHSVKIAPKGEFFNLASDEKSRSYVDIKKMAQNGESQRDLSYLLYDKLASGDFGPVEAVAGVALGGCHLASITAMYGIFKGGSVPLHVIYVRKEPKAHGTKSLIEGPSLPEGTRIVLLEDVITTGGSSWKAIDALDEAGFDVCGLLAVVDRRKERIDFSSTLCKYPVRSLFTLEDIDDFIHKED